jgi:hypothetical protein
MSEYEALEDFFHTFLNQDWYTEYEGEPWRTVLDFTRLGPDIARHARREVALVLASDRSEDELRQLVLDDLDCAYTPERDGWTYRGWLTELTSRIDRYLHLGRTEVCPVCGYPHLTESPRRRSGTGSRELCPSCGVRFGFGPDDDYRSLYLQWRQRWIDRGMPWELPDYVNRPKNWSPREQLRQLLGTTGMKEESSSRWSALAHKHVRARVRPN